MTNLRLATTPYVRIVIPFSIGIMLSAWIEMTVPAYADFLMLCCAVAVAYLSQVRYLYQYRWIFGTVYAFFLVLFGFYYALNHNEMDQAAHFSKQGQAVNYVVGTINDAPSMGSRVKVRLHVDAAGPAYDSLKPSTGSLLLFLELNPMAESLQYGDRIGVHASVQRTPAFSSNPYAFDYGRYLHFQNIHHQAFVKSDSILLLSSGHGYAVWRAAFNWRKRLLNILQHYFPNQDEYAVASALLVGYKDDLSEDLRIAYAETGSMHALAVSGTHVSMLYLAVMGILSNLPLQGRKGRYTESFVALLLIWTFTFVTGATASVLRASVMFSIFLIGRAAFQSTTIWNTLANSAFFLLIFNPYLLFDAGFQLSYAAVAGMAYFYPVFLKNLPQIKSKYWILNEGWQLLLVSFAAQLGTLPLSLYYFHQFPVYFWLAGWVVVLGGAIFMAGGALLVFLDLLVPIVAKWLGVVLYYLLWGMNQIIIGIQGLPCSVISGIWISDWAALLMYVGIILWGIGLNQKRGGSTWYFKAGVVIVLLLFCRSVRSIIQQQEQSIVVYSVNRARLIDFFDGTSIVSLSDTLSRRQWTFAAQANRWAMGMSAHNLYHFADSLGETSTFRYESPFIQFYDRRMVVVDDVKWVQHFQVPSSTIDVDVLLLSKNPRLSIKDCLKIFSTREVVADNTNSRKRVAQWKSECKTLQIPFHDIREQGAWVSIIASK